MTPASLPPTDPQRRRACAQLGGLAAAALLPTLAAAAPTPLPQSLLDAFAAAGIPPDAAALDLRWLDDPNPLLQWQAQRPLPPASVLKLLPTYVGLRTLGPDWRWQTGVWAAGSLHAGVLDGDLVLVGSGDPHLVSEDLWLLARRLRGLGLRRIRGNVVADRSLYALPAHDAAAFDGAGDAPYNAGPDPLLFNFDALSLQLQPLAGRVGMALQPPLAGFAPRRAPQLAAGPCGDWKQALRADWRDPLHPRFAGRYAAACGTRSWNLSPTLGPDALLGGALAEVFAEVGIGWSGRVVAGRLPTDATLLTRWESAPLAQLVVDINKFSNNVMAQQLFLQLGLEAGGAPADFDKASAALRAWLDQHQLAMPDLVLDNGCGLSRSARIRADDLQRLLLQAWHSPVMPEFVASLPLAAVDGTLQHRWSGTPLAGRLHAKTGSLDGVLSLAGYVQTPNGRRAALVALIDHPRAARGWGVFEALAGVAVAAGGGAAAA